MTFGQILLHLAIEITPDSSSVLGFLSVGFFAHVVGTELDLALLRVFKSAGSKKSTPGCHKKCAVKVKCIYLTHIMHSSIEKDDALSGCCLVAACLACLYM